jgi:mannose-6-phosphate isomerase-like protein (cupin superfamily)
MTPLAERKQFKKMNLLFDSQISKEKVFLAVKDFLEKRKFCISRIDQERPWGGFFVIDESESAKFISEFFNNIDDSNNPTATRISPKILIVEPYKRLSWQYHFRRSEIWKVIGSAVGVARSADDVEKVPETIHTNEIILLKRGERHRLIGLNSWGIVAEIWQHIDTSNPSDEDDIVRLQDDFGR